MNEELSASIHDLLVLRAGLTEEHIELGKPDYSFDQVIEAFRSIHRGKEVLYGNYLETHGSDPLLFALMEHFSDTKRKYVRALTFIKQVANGQPISLMELLDTYSDLGVYSAMGVQLCLHLMEREDGGTATGPGRSPGGKPDPALDGDERIDDGDRRRDAAGPPSSRTRHPSELDRRIYRGAPNGA